MPGSRRFVESNITINITGIPAAMLGAVYANKDKRFA
jgi:hypothetical protein